MPVRREAHTPSDEHAVDEDAQVLLHEQRRLLQRMNLRFSSVSGTDCVLLTLENGLEDLRRGVLGVGEGLEHLVVAVGEELAFEREVVVELVVANEPA